MNPARPDLRLLAVLALFALGACAGALLSGMASALTYTAYEPAVRATGVTLQHLRPVHETFAFAWIFLGGVTVVHLHLITAFGPLGRGARVRFAAQIGLWVAAGIGITATLLAGRFTGREYLGYSPVFSALILAGWLLFAWNYFTLNGWSLRGRPAYIYMWTVGIPLFVYTYAEGHAYLLDFLSRRPLRDLAVQWKSNGVLVGAFNQIAYGGMMYVSCRMRQDESYAHGRTAFALFFVGVLNTFSNYGHHTFHLPQTSWIHWISFVVSMLEVIILAKVGWDLFGLFRPSEAAADVRVPDLFFRSTTAWLFVMLLAAIVISVPPLNGLIHGTHVVVFHSMGSMIAINTMLLWGALSYVVRLLAGPAHPMVVGRGVRRIVPFLHASLALFLASFLARGLAAGWSRYAGASAPDFSPLVQAFPDWMAGFGYAMAIAALWLVTGWARALWPAIRGRAATPVPAEAEAAQQGGIG